MNTEDPPVKRGRGRPKGSKNKPKNTMPEVQPSFADTAEVTFSKSSLKDSTQSTRSEKGKEKSVTFATLPEGLSIVHFLLESYANR